MNIENNQRYFHNYKEEEYNSITKKIHELLRQSCYEFDNYEKIIKLYQKIPDKEKTGEQTRCAVSALIFLKQMNEARLLLDKWQDVGKDDVQWNTQYGWTYYLEQNYKEAIPYFDRVEDLTPTDTHILNYLRECNEKVGNKEEAKRLKEWCRDVNVLTEPMKSIFQKNNYYSSNGAKEIGRKRYI